MSHRHAPRMLAAARRPYAISGLVLVVVALGCGGGVPPTSSPASTAAASLECEAQAFPCTFADVEQSIVSETDRLASQAAQRITDGATSQEAITWLDDQPTVAEVEGDTDSIRFRPVGGRPVWLSLPAGRSAPPASSRQSQMASAGTWDSGPSLGSPPRIDASIAGPGLSERKALVLSPYRWDFGDSDDGEAVAAQLGAVPDYAGRVTYTANATVGAQDVSVDDFQGWQGLQLVHVVSHGMRLCAAGKCRAVVAAHSIPNGLADLANSSVRGLEVEVVVGGGGAPQATHHVLLGADFFRAEYPRGLDDAVVFLNGCATFGAGATDLADAIRGQTSVVLGWSRAVATDAAHAAGIGMLNELGGNARTVGDALKTVGPLATSQFQKGSAPPVVANLTSSGRAAGGDLRIRELVTFSNSTGSAPLADGSEVALIGQPEDGAPDSVAWQVRVDGIDTAQASALLQVTIDGRAAPAVPVSSGVTQAPGSWLLTGTLNLGVDVSVPHPAPFNVTLALPEGGQSVDAVGAVLVGTPAQPTPGAPTMGSVWRGIMTDRFEVKPGVWIEREADLTFTLDPSTVQYRYHVYDVTSGTMTFAVHGTDPSSGCTNTLAPFEVAVTDDNTSGGFRIDTQSSPPLFDGSVTITGPEVDVAQTGCSAEYAYLNGSYGTRAQGVFIQVFASEEPAVPVVDGRVTGKSLYGDRTFDLSRSE